MKEKRISLATSQKPSYLNPMNQQESEKIQTAAKRPVVVGDRDDVSDAARRELKGK